MDGTEHAFNLKEDLLGGTIYVRGWILCGGIHLSVFGGTVPHIGAVSVAGPEGFRWDTEFPGHRDGVIARRWTDVLRGEGTGTLVVEVGIHFDHPGRAGIEAITAAADRLLERVQREIREYRQDNARSPGAEECKGEV